MQTTPNTPEAHVFKTWASSRASKPWNDWYHLIANTYGTWLPGDPRGFRTRRHREHVEGDYKNPPPQGIYERRHIRAKQSLKREPVVLSSPARQLAVSSIVYALASVHQIEVLAASVSGEHLHLLARFPSARKRKPMLSKHGLRMSSLDDPPRHYLGIAKKESAKLLTHAKLVPPGGVWALRGKIKPIHDRQHQINVFNYILDHHKENAAVWTFRNPKPML